MSSPAHRRHRVPALSKQSGAAGALSQTNDPQELPIRFTMTARPEDKAVRFDHLLAAQIPELSRSRLQALIKSGFATLNGAPTTPGTRLRAGDAVVVREPPPVEADVHAEDIALEILFEDDDLIVINKPAGLVVHPGAGHGRGTLVNALLHHCGALSRIGGIKRPGIVHRLDKETSGCLVAAKTDLAHLNLSRQFAGRTMKKVYLALVAGRLRVPRGEIKESIGRHPVHRTKMAVVKNGRGRPAQTSWRLLREIGDASLLECTLHTGRTHQIRVHLKHLGHPVLGDEVYGKREMFSRQMLHAWRLGFHHPRHGNLLEFQSPIPDDFIAAGVPPELS